MHAPSHGCMDTATRPQDPPLAALAHQARWKDYHGHVLQVHDGRAAARRHPLSLVAIGEMGFGPR